MTHKTATELLDACAQDSEVTDAIRRLACMPNDLKDQIRGRHDEDDLLGMLISSLKSSHVMTIVSALHDLEQRGWGDDRSRLPIPIALASQFPLSGHIYESHNVEFVDLIFKCWAYNELHKSR